MSMYCLQLDSLQSANLIGVAVRVRGINLQPVFGRVATALGVGSLAQPVFISHAPEQLSRGRPRAAERFERGSEVTIVVPEPRRELFLVVALDDRTIFDQ